ncbi:apoptosis-associated speck-like protein containing a CARD [Emydura macquarii macquarii]|uniref:apoptosis-associated speck-like protein containing a CARD n=1 Tax=Emydura macquarii macquarii TaxID=1129001 RepID=UPI00352A66C0
MLNVEDLWNIQAEGSDPERMRKLYELVPGWNTLRKDWLYWVLTVTNPALIEELEAPFGPAEHFVMRHGEKLIRRVSLVDRVLHLLHGDVLNDEQCRNILAEGSNLERMRKLYELVPGWDTLRKNRLYRMLAITNPALIEELEGEHFVERHRVLLIWRASRVDEVLAQLGRDVLDDEQSRRI